MYILICIEIYIFLFHLNQYCGSSFEKRVTKPDLQESNSIRKQLEWTRFEQTRNNIQKIFSADPTRIKPRVGLDSSKIELPTRSRTPIQIHFNSLCCKFRSFWSAVNDYKLTFLRCSCKKKKGAMRQRYF